jgi:hypothetical protein
MTVGTSITFPDAKSTQVVACTNEALCTQSADFSGTFEVSVESGFLNDVNLEAVSGEVSSAGPENSSASADPLIVIDPLFANAADYSIVLSPGVANAVESGVPEPSYVLLIGGFGGDSVGDSAPDLAFSILRRSKESATIRQPREALIIRRCSMSQAIQHALQGTFDPARLLRDPSRISQPDCLGQARQRLALI